MKNKKEQDPGRQIDWSARTGEWFDRASAYSGFHGNLAKLLVPLFTDRSELCDLGCGNGILDLCLCPYFDRMTCVDRSPEALRLFSQKLKGDAAAKVRLLEADIYELEGTWTNVLMSFAGLQYADAGRLFSYFSKQLVIVSGDPMPETFAGRIKEEGLVCREKPCVLEYGQPFKDPEEAAAYGILQKIPDIDARLEETGDEAYPLYLPNRKSFTIYEILKS